jgi:hypothetical protein
MLASSLYSCCFFLHPEYVMQARQLPPTVLTENDDICQITQYYYRRFVSDDDSGLRGEMFDWLEGTYTTLRVDFNEDAVFKFWKYERKSKHSSKLPELALTILSIAVNTATCERLFSELALVLTPKRNRMSIEKTTKHQMRQYVRETNRREKPMPTSSKKLLRTIDPSERPCLATPQNSTRSTPARSTPANPTPAQTRTPARGSRNVFATPDRHAQDQHQSTPLERVLFSELQDIGAVAARSLGPSEASAPLVQAPKATTPSDPPTSSCSTAAIFQTLLEDETVDTLTSDLDTVALSDQHLDEYLEHFDWEEIGEYGDEYTIDMWSNVLDAPNTTTGTSSTIAGKPGTADDSGANAESNASEGDGEVGQSDSTAAEDDTTGAANNDAGDGSPFTTIRLGTYADSIPAANRLPYPPENDPNFPQEKRLEGIRARKTSLASLASQR